MQKNLEFFDKLKLCWTVYFFCCQIVKKGHRKTGLYRSFDVFSPESMEQGKWDLCLLSEEKMYIL